MKTGVEVYPKPVPVAIEIEATEVGVIEAVATAVEGMLKLISGVLVKSLTVLVMVMLAIEVGARTGSSCAPPVPEIEMTGSAVKLPKFAGSRVTPAIGPDLSWAVATGVVVQVIPTGVMETVGADV